MKILLKTLLALFLAFALFWVAAWGFLQTDRGQKWAVGALVQFVENRTELRIATDHIDIFFPAGFRATNITLTEKGNQIAAAQEIEAFCDYWQLLEGRLIFSSFRARNLDLLALPSNQSEGNGNFQFHGNALIPFYIKIEKISFENVWLSPSVIQRLTLPPELAGQADHSRFNLKGSVTNNPFNNTLSSQLSIDLSDEKGKATGQTLALNLSNHQLSISFHAKTISRPLEWGNERVDFDAAIAFSASGPLNSWLNFLEGDQDAPIEGSFKIIAYPKNDQILALTCGQEIVIKGKYSVQPGLRDRPEITCASRLHQSPRVERSETIQNYNMGSFPIAQPRELSCGLDAQVISGRSLSFKIENFHLTCPGINLRAKANLSSNFHIYEGSFDGMIEETEHFSSLIQKNLHGPLAFTGEASGPFSFPNLFINGTSPALTVQGKTFKNLESTLSAVHTEGGMKGFAKILFDYAEAPFDFASSFQWNGQQLFLEDIKGTFCDATADGTLSFAPKDPLLTGRLEIRSGNFQKLSSFLGTPCEGSGNVMISLTHFLDENGIKHQRIESDLAAQEFQWENLSSKNFSAQITMNRQDKDKLLFNVLSHLKTESLRFKDLSAAQLALEAAHQIDLTDLTLSKLSTQMTAEKIEWADGKAERAFFDIYLPQTASRLNGKLSFVFDHIEAFSSPIVELRGETAIDFNQPLWPLTLEGKGKLNEDWAFSLNGQWHAVKGSFDLHFQTLNGFFEGNSFFLLKPAALSRNAEKIEVSATQFKWGQVEIEGQFLKENQNIDFQFSTNAINANLLNRFFPHIPIEGAASFKGFLRGPAEDPFGEIQLVLDELTVAERFGVKKFALRGKADLAINKSGIQLKTLLDGIGASPIRLYGTLPYQLTLTPFSLHQNPDIPLSLNLEAEGEIDPFADLFYNDTAHLTGHARMALNLTGQLDAPLVKGSLELENGTYESLNSGSLYRNIQARFEGEGTKVALKSFSADNTHGGSLTATGTIELDKNNDFPFVFFIKPKKIYAVESEYANLSASGSLRLSGNQKKSKLEGELSTDTAAIDLERALPKQIKSVDVQFINLQKGEEPFQPDTPKISSSIELDLKLNLPNNARIEGKNLTSRWKGSLMIAGTPKDPLLFGDLRVSEGEYKFNGKAFNLTQGTIHFSGLLAKKTSIYVVASRDIGKIKADIIVKGPTNKLAVSFRSTPPLSQREILSYILFNRGISDITPDQGDQLSQSFISLNETESAGSDDFLTRLRNNIGLDRLDILPQSFQVGKYITEGVFVSIDKTKDLGNRLIVEADVLKNLKAQAEVQLGGEAQQKFSLKWKKDY